MSDINQVKLRGRAGGDAEVKTRLRKVLDEVQTNQAEHAAHLDRLEHRTDALRANSAANRLLTSKNAEQLNALAQEAKELRSNAAQAEREIDRLTAQTKTAAEELWAQIERIDDKIIKVLSTFRRVADAGEDWRG